MIKHLTLLLLLATSAASAYSLMPRHSEHDRRFNLGLRGGMATMWGRADTTQLQTSAAGVASVERCGRVYAGIPSFQGGAYAEVGYRACNWSYGALFDVYGDTLNKRWAVITSSKKTAPKSDDVFNKTFHCSLHIGGDIRGGYYTDNTLWYALIGAEGLRMRFEHNLQVESGIFDASNPAIINFCNDYWKAALRVGTGIEYNITQCVNIKLEFRYLWAGKKCFSGEGLNTTVDTVGSLRVVDTNYFNQQSTTLMVGYNF